MEDIHVPEVYPPVPYEEGDTLEKVLTNCITFGMIGSMRVPYPVTLYEGTQVAGMALPDGTLIEAAQTRVGSLFTDPYEGICCEVVWDGASKLLLLDDYQQTGRLWEDLKAGRTWVLPPPTARLPEAE